MKGICLNAEEILPVWNLRFAGRLCLAQTAGAIGTDESRFFDPFRQRIVQERVAFVLVMPLGGNRPGRAALDAYTAGSIFVKSAIFGVTGVGAFVRRPFYAGDHTAAAMGYASGGDQPIG